MKYWCLVFFMFYVHYVTYTVMKREQKWMQGTGQYIK